MRMRRRSPKRESLELAPDAAGVPALAPPPAKSPLAAAAAQAAAPAATKAKTDAAIEGLLQMTCGRSSSRSMVRIKSHWVSSCRA